MPERPGVARDYDIFDRFTGLICQAQDSVTRLTPEE